MPPKRRKTEEDKVIEKYNLEEVKATREWTKETFKIQSNKRKGDALELKALNILRAQNIATIMIKAQLMEETPKGMKLIKLIGDGNIDLFGEITVRNQTLQWIGQCKMTKTLGNNVINEMKGLLLTRPNTIGIIIHGGSKSQQVESFVDTANSDIFVCHIEELHTIRKQIETKQVQRGIQTTSVTRMFIEEMEDVEFDKNGRIIKARKVKNVSTQIWGTESQNEDILF